MNTYTFDRQSIKDGTLLHDFPVNVIVETSAYCNLKCIMCPHSSLKREKGNMNLDVFQKIVDEVASINPDTTLWLALMGEPLMNPGRLTSMIIYAKRHGLTDVRLNTNGLLLTTLYAESLVSLGLDYILVSVDAHQSRTYEKIRAGGDLHKLTKNIECILALRNQNQSKLKIVTQFIIMDENETEVDDFKEYWLEKGAIVKIRPKLSWGNTVPASNLNLTQCDRTYPCPWLLRTMSIHWTGKLAQCDFDFEGEYSPGDITKQTIRQIWHGEIRRRQLRHFTRDFTHPLCRTCKDWQVGRSLFFEKGKGSVNG